MAFRAAASAAASASASAKPRVSGVIAVGGDIPPEIAPGALGQLSAALLARGTEDAWYTQEKFAADEHRLRDCSVPVHALEFKAGHEWSSELVAAASRFLVARHP
jgi:predicted esterase